MHIVKIKYTGNVSVLNGHMISIPVAPYTCHNRVRECARSYIEKAIPIIYTLSSPNDIFNHVDKGGVSVLIHWEIIEN